ncbi:hypothetical protein [Sinanaerobacter chloroacetimidivorans]|jgi:hypothetical protein|uniref:Uncharacterized protein n=1 Tax=Sinanaerobacter chloroacetimidivorans TaxID=2818044 RepID=A0A8J8B407_9FIRM|nr:hypothetical protein [Sinanaerobacter chloroacetimidivorans]MBR0598855.1 hypothetical protein [Sinanaerobacter chloroacetimidivorans]
MNKKFQMGVGLGGPSIIMIFVVLCLSTLGALSLVTANADWKLTQKAAEAVTAYYHADCEAEEILASADATLKAGQPLEANSFYIPVSENQDLFLSLTQENGRLAVLSQKLIVKSEWDYNSFETEYNDTLVIEK